MKDWIITFMEEFGYLGITLIIALENVFPPIPSEIILPFAGVLTTKTVLSVPGVIFASTLGSILGAVILYGVGRFANVRRLEKFIDRWGRVLRIEKKDIRNAEGWFIRYGSWTVFFCRLVPVVRSLISIPAGMAKMNFVTFVVFSTLGTAIWNTILVGLGAILGDSWGSVLKYMDVYKSIVYALFILIGFLFILHYFKKKGTNR